MSTEALLDVLLDVDTGVDDALAILLAVRHPALRVRAITCVAGNTNVDQVVRNTLRVLDAAGAQDIPVARGAERPLLAPNRPANHVHGADGMADLGLPESTRAPVADHAVELLRRQIMAADQPVTLITLAPLTNIALLLRCHPAVAERIGRVVSMAGSASVGNASAVAEFNAWHDPEAAAIVLGAGLPLTLYGLDVFYQVTVPDDTIRALSAESEPGLRLAGRLLHHLGSRPRRGKRTAGPASIGDAGAVCAVADPDGLVTQLLPVRVELTGATTRGQTVVDRREMPGEDEVHGVLPAGDPALVDVALGVDGDRYRDLFLGALRGAR
ncbi:MAG TPA: nucleoside hydrolase [Pseudonocardiaceae bacterium]